MSQAQITKKQRELTKARIQEESISREMEPQKLGEETVAVIPNSEMDVLVMYVAHQANMQIKNAVRNANRKSGLMKSYGISEDSDQAMLLQEYFEKFDDGFEKTKKECEKVVKKHPLSVKICQIKGISAYQLGLVMSFIRQPERFDCFSKLAVYSGCGVKYGHHVSKKNINTINNEKHNRYVGDEDNFSKFGYSTDFQQRLYIIADSLMKQKGWFYDFYKNQKIRLAQTAVNDGRAVMVGERYYMTAVDLFQYEVFGKFVTEQPEQTPIATFRARKNQSLDAWTNSNARWRMCRMFLNFVYEEWMKLRGFVPREPYVFEHLGHTSKITLDHVLAWEVKLKE